MKVYITCCNLGQISYLENVHGQSDGRIFKSSISLEQNDEKDWFFACWYKFIEIVVINGCAHCGHRILKLTVSHEEINGINWFLVCWYTGKLKVTLIVVPLLYEGSYKIAVVCLSSCHDFWHNGR